MCGGYWEPGRISLPKSPTSRKRREKWGTLVKASTVRDEVWGDYAGFAIGNRGSDVVGGFQPWA